MAALNVTKYKVKNGIRAFNSWIVPYAKSRFYYSGLRPVLSYLFTEWKCNIDCGYCFQYNNNGTNMSYETAVSSMDWLRSIGCNVVAIMGGEPLLRPDFILKVIKYGSSKGMFVYLPTNGYLLTKEYVDKFGKVGVAAINLAVDAISPKPGLPKALMPIESQFRYLVSQQEKYGYLLFFNINITSKNIKDVKMLTEIAHDNGIATDYHINEPPQDIVNVSYASLEDDLFIRPGQYKEVDELLDWLIKKNREGYPMVNSAAHLEAMKGKMRNKEVKWDCRAGHNGILIKPDGTLSPCFDLITHDYDWGRIWEPRFDKNELAKVKAECNKRCLSTCFYTMGFYYQPREILTWMMKHTKLGKKR